MPISMSYSDQQYLRNILIILILILLNLAISNSLNHNILCQFMNNLIPVITDSGWIQQNRRPTFNWLSGIQFTGSKTGWITGDCGVIIQTKDGGESWNLPLCQYK